MTDLKTLNIQIDFIKGKMIMNVIFCRSEFTMTKLDAAIEFYDECSKLLSIYVVNPEEWETVIYAHNEKDKIFNMLF